MFYIIWLFTFKLVILYFIDLSHWNMSVMRDIASFIKTILCNNLFPASEIVPGT